MSKAEILAELPKLRPDELREVMDYICTLEDQHLLAGDSPTAAERELLDQELANFKTNPNAGSTWEEAEARLRQQFSKSSLSEKCFLDQGRDAAWRVLCPFAVFKVDGK